MSINHSTARVRVATANRMVTTAKTVEIAEATARVRRVTFCWENALRRWRCFWFNAEHIGRRVRCCFEFLRDPFADCAAHASDVVVDVQVQHSVVRSTAGARLRTEIRITSRQIGPVENKVAGRRWHNRSKCDEIIAATFLYQVWPIVPDVVSLLSFTNRFIFHLLLWLFYESKTYATFDRAFTPRRPALIRVNSTWRPETIEFPVHLVDVSLNLLQRLMQRFHSGYSHAGTVLRARWRHDAFQIFPKVDAEALADQRLAVLVLRWHGTAGQAVPTSRPQTASVVHAAQCWPRSPAITRPPQNLDLIEVQQLRGTVRPTINMHVIIIRNSDTGRKDGRRVVSGGRQRQTRGVEFGTLGHQSWDEAMIGTAPPRHIAILSRHFHLPCCITERIVVEGRAASINGVHLCQPVGNGQCPSKVTAPMLRVLQRQIAQHILQTAGVRVSAMESSNIREAAQHVRWWTMSDWSVHIIRGVGVTILLRLGSGSIHNNSRIRRLHTCIINNRSIAEGVKRKQMKSVVIFGHLHSAAYATSVVLLLGPTFSLGHSSSPRSRTLACSHTAVCSTSF